VRRPVVAVELAHCERRLLRFRHPLVAAGEEAVGFGDEGRPPRRETWKWRGRSPSKPSRSTCWLAITFS
jgi:hypothetical protein